MTILMDAYNYMPNVKGLGVGNVKSTLVFTMFLSDIYTKAFWDRRLFQPKGMQITWHSVVLSMFYVAQNR